MPNGLSEVQKVDLVAKFSVRFEIFATNYFKNVKVSSSGLRFFSRTG